MVSLKISLVGGELTKVNSITEEREREREREKELNLKFYDIYTRSSTILAAIVSRIRNA